MHTPGCPPGCPQALVGTGSQGPGSLCAAAAHLPYISAAVGVQQVYKHPLDPNGFLCRCRGFLFLSHGGSRAGCPGQSVRYQGAGLQAGVGWAALRAVSCWTPMSARPRARRLFGFVPQGPSPYPAEVGGMGTADLNFAL